MAIIGDHPASSTTTIEGLHPDMLIGVLRRMDGPTLVSASCASSHLSSLSTQHDLWRDLCLSTRPSLRQPHLLHLISSFPNSHRSFFSDAYPFPSSSLDPRVDDDARLPNNLISAIDLYHRGIPVLSKVVETDASSSWFRSSPFRIDSLDRKYPHPVMETLAMVPGELTLSLTVIDPSGRQAVNVSSRRPVAVDQHWYNGETLVRFATVLGEGCTVGAVVACRRETGQVREISLTVEDMDGSCLSGRDSLVILKEAMEGRRRWKEAEEEAQQRYAEHVRSMKWRKEQTRQREQMLDFCCSGVVVFLAFLVLVVFR